MSEKTMADIIEALSGSYTDDGVAIVLGSHHKLLDGERPIDLCRTAEGRQRVWEMAEACNDGVFT